MKKYLFLLVILSLFKIVPAQENNNEVLINYLKANWVSPEDYVISKFENHDYVFIGEYHRVKHEVELITNLIPLLFENDIYNLGIELGLYDNQKIVDSLINAPVFNRRLADSIFFNFSPTWAYKEYIDIYEVAWQVNQTDTSNNSNKFRVINLGAKYDPCKEGEAWHDIDPDKYMADVIFKEIVDKGQKALIYSGFHHAFTKYREPLHDFKKDTTYGLDSGRMGNIIYDSLREKTFNIYLHAGWISKKGVNHPVVKPVNGIIEEVMESFTDKRVGFDVVNSPFGELTATDTYFAFGHPNFTLDEFCDGCIYQYAYADYEPITMEQDFITENNIDRLKSYLRCYGLPNIYVNSIKPMNANKKFFEDATKHFKHLKK